MRAANTSAKYSGMTASKFPILRPFAFLSRCIVTASSSAGVRQVVDADLHGHLLGPSVARGYFLAMSFAVQLLSCNVACGTVYTEIMIVPAGLRAGPTPAEKLASFR